MMSKFNVRQTYKSYNLQASSSHCITDLLLTAILAVP